MSAAPLDLACGAVTAYVLRLISFRAGAYAPGIHEHWFDELATAGGAGDLETVRRWFARREDALRELGYRTHVRAVAIPTCELITWVARGRGYRGAIVAQASGPVAIAVDRLEPEGDDRLLVIAPTDGEPECRPAPAALERDAAPCAGLEIYWSGWS